MGISRRLMAAAGALLASATPCVPASAAPANDPHALFMASAFEAPKKGACEVLSPDPAYVNEMLVRFNADGSKAAPEKRVALVIGNGAYETFPDLKNPANDAAAVARLLRGLGFAVWRGVDLTSASASACLADFYRRGAEGAHVALLYYAGHGVSAGGVNALLPTDASFTDASESALNKSLPVDAILAEMRKRAISSLLFLDACRSSLGRGFAAIRPEGSSAGTGAQRQTKVAPGSDSGGGSGPALGGFYYVYAAAPNATASDGEVGHSPFTRAFLDHAGTPGQMVQELVTDVTRDVIRAASQVPYADGSLTEDVHLNGDISEREMASRSSELAAQSARLREQGQRGRAVAAALKGMPREWAESDTAKTFADTRAELFRVLDSRNVTFSGHESQVDDAAFSPDGTRIVTAASDFTAKIWDAQTGELLKTLLHSNDVLSAEFSTDGARIVTASDDMIASIWDARTGALMRTLKGHGDSVQDAAFSPDGARIVTASNDSTAKIWDSKTGALIRTLGHQDEVDSAAFSPDGARIVTASGDGSARIWDAKTGALLKTLSGHSSPFTVASVSFSPDGARIATASWDDTARLWDARSGALIKILTGHGDAVTDIAFSPDGARLATGSWDRTARLWDAQSGALLKTLDHAESVNSVAFSRDGGRLLTAASDNTAKVWDIKAGGLLQTLENAGEVGAVAFSPDGARLATASGDHTARLWDARSGALLKTLTGHAEGVTDLAFSRDGTRIVTVSRDGAAKIWDASARSLPATPSRAGASEAPLTTLRVSSRWALTATVAFSPDGERIATSGGDNNVKIWDVKTGAPIRTLEGAFRAEFSPDGALIVASSDVAAKVWDAKTGALVRSLEDDMSGEHVVMSSAFSPDGARIVTASFDRTARVWDTRTGEMLETFDGHGDSVYGAEFSPDGARIVTASIDNTAKVWDAMSGALLKTLEGHGGWVNGAAFSPDGASVVTASSDRTAKIWDAGLYGPELLEAAYDLLTDDLRAEVERERIRYWEVDPALLQ